MKREGCILSVSTAIIMLLFFAVFTTGCGEETPPTMPVESGTAPAYSTSGLSPDQNEYVEELGYPDHFFISIDPYGTDRVEMWVYFSEGKALDFNNGRFSGEEAVEDESAEYPPTDLLPQDFSTLMTPGEAVQMLGEPVYTHEVEESLLPENTIMVFEKAVLLFRDEQLIGVDTQVRPPRIPAPQ